jgi:hypothetical protein
MASLPELRTYNCKSCGVTVTEAEEPRERRDISQSRRSDHEQSNRSIRHCGFRRRSHQRRARRPQPYRCFGSALMRRGRPSANGLTHVNALERLRMRLKPLPPQWKDCRRLLSIARGTFMRPNNVLPIASELPGKAGEAIGLHPKASVPDYLRAHYWWALYQLVVSRR